MPPERDIAAALAAAKVIGIARLDAQILLGNTVGRDRSWLVAHANDPLSPHDFDRFVATCRRRASGEPLAYLTGEREFHGISLEVSPAVLIPRPETEVLVDWAIELLRSVSNDRQRPRVLDLGTGSGAIAIAIACACRAARVTAIDIDPQSLRVAVRNAERCGVRIEFVFGNWWQAVAGRRFDLIVSNPPYIAEGDPHLDQLLPFEPRHALVSGPDGLNALREIAGGAADHLAAGAWIVVEHGFDQGEQAAAIFAKAGMTQIEQRRDLGEHIRCTAGRNRD